MNNENFEILIEKFNSLEDKVGRLSANPAQTSVRQVSNNRENDFKEQLQTLQTGIASIGQHLKYQTQVQSELNKRLLQQGQQQPVPDIDGLADRLAATIDRQGQNIENILRKEFESMRYDLHAVNKLVLHSPTRWMERNLIYVCMMIALTASILIFSLKANYDQSQRIGELELSELKYRALKTKLPVDFGVVVWLDQNINEANGDAVKATRKAVAHYEDSVRRRIQMELVARQKDSIANVLIQDAERIKNELNKAKGK